MGTEKYGLPKINGTDSVKVPRDLNALADAVDLTVSREVNRLDAITSSIASGAPKAVFPTVNDLKTAKPSGDGNIYVVSNDGKWYFWSGTDWVPGGIYQATSIAEKSVAPTKTTFFKMSSNLFDPSTVLQNTLLYSGVGTTVTVNGYITSDYIDVSSLTDVTIAYARGYSFYSATKTFISGQDAFRKAWTITVPSGVAFIRICWDVVDKPLAQQQLNAGATLLAFEPFRRFIGNEFLDQGFSTSRIPERSLSAEQMQFLSRGSNLFNPSTVQRGKFLYDNGFVASDSNFVLSDFIDVSGVARITVKDVWHYCFYNSSKTWISGVVASQKQSLTIEVPPTAVFIRISWGYGGDENNIVNQQVNTGANLLVFEPYGKKLASDIFPAYASKEIELTLPRKLFALVGQELNIYFDNILNDKATRYDFFVECTIGKQNEDFFRIKPTAPGTYPLKIRVVKDDKDVAFATSTITVKSASVGNGVTKKIIIVGDSTTASGEAITKLNQNLSTDVYKVQTIGTLGTGANKHEGRSGWTALQYTTVAVDANNSSVTNAFWNPSTSKFDFAYYISNNGVSTPDYVVLNLGINDTFLYVTDTSLHQRIDQFFAQYDQMIDSIRAFNSTIKIGIALTIPPNSSQDAFGRAYGTGQTRGRYKRNNFLLVQRLIRKYDGRENENLYVVPINVNLDTKYNFPIDAAEANVPVNARNTDVLVRNFATSAGVHPAQSGYWQIADVYWYWLKSFES